jgi:hypothetical protein
VLWMATKGTKWFLRRSVDLIPYMLFMAAREALVQPREWAGAGVPDCAPVRYAIAGRSDRPSGGTGGRPPGRQLPPVRDTQAAISQTAEPVAE